MDAVGERLKNAGINASLEPDWRGLIDKCGLAVVNTRPDLNAPVTARLLEEGIDVYCEKPLALTLKQLDELIRADQRSEERLSCMLGLRFSPEFTAMRQHIGEIGEIRMVNAQKSYKLGRRAEYYDSRETFGGIIPWVGIHGIDWAHALIDRPFTRVSAVSDNEFNAGHGDMDMTALCMFETEGGCLVSVRSDFLRPESAELSHGDDRVRAVGTKGILEMRGGRVFLTDPQGTRELETEKGQDHFALFMHGREEAVSAYEGLYMTLAALCARDAADRGEWVNIPSLTL